MATITFDDGTNPAVQVRTHQWPQPLGDAYPVVVGRTMGGGFKTADLGDGTQRFDATLEFREYPDADAQDLFTFFRTTVNRSETSFTYTDPDGTDFTNMRYVSGLETWRKVDGKWFGQLVLSKDMSL